MDPSHDRPGPTFDRRAFLAAGLAGGLAGRLARAGDRAPADLRADLQAAVDRLDEVGIERLRGGRSRRYQVVGNAPDDFLNRTLALAESFADLYLTHFRRMGLPADEPPGRLTIVALADRRTYEALTADSPDLADSLGFYRTSTNAVHVFDVRTEPPDRRPGDPALASEMNLRHELSHQLAFNTGLLRRGGDTPAAVVEGLAEYCEPVAPGGRGEPGQVHRPWVDLLGGKLIDDHAPGSCRLSLTELLTSDDWLAGLSTEEVRWHARAHGWLLIHYLLGRPPHRPAFKSYLEATNARDRVDDPGPAHLNARLADAREHLGDLDALADALDRHAGLALGGQLPGSSRYGRPSRRR